MKHTSGPWQSHDDYTTDGFVTIIGNIDGEYVDGKPECTYDVVCVCEDWYGERLPNVAANARLIAAAPDMLDALQFALALLDEGPQSLSGTMQDGSRVWKGSTHERIEAMRAAIAKATGADLAKPLGPATISLPITDVPA